MRLFGRKWSVQIVRTDYTGLDMSFSVVKTTRPEPNTCELRLYNLSEASRAELEETPLVKIPAKGKGPAKHQHEGIPVRITAGYEEADSLIWSGDLRTVESTHVGSDWVTTLTSGDGEQAYHRARVNMSFGPGTPVSMVIKKLAENLGVGAGNVDLVAARLAMFPRVRDLADHGLVLSGSAAERLTAWCQSLGFEWSIQDGALQFVERGKPMIGRVVLLGKETGMVGTPSIDQEGLLTVQMLMIPGVLPGSVFVMNANRIQGNFRIETATYEGDTSGEPWTITVEAKRY